MTSAHEHDLCLESKYNRVLLHSMWPDGNYNKH